MYGIGCVFICSRLLRVKWCSAPYSLLYQVYIHCIHLCFSTMLPLDNKHTEPLQEYRCEPFKEMFVEQVERAKESVFEEMRQELNITDNQDVRACYMAKKTVTREKLISWLEAVSCILDSFAVPLLY